MSTIDTTFAAPIRLNLGGGDVAREGFTTIDRKSGSEAYPLEYADGSVDEIYASHILEHFPKSKRDAVLKDWFRALKPGGRLRVSVPDAVKAARMMLDGVTELTNTDGQVYKFDYESVLLGGQTDTNDFHGSMYCEDSLWEAFQVAGFTSLDTWKSDNSDTSALPFCANIEGYKPPECFKDGVFTKATCAVLSMPRLTFTAAMQCLFRALPHKGIKIDAITGAFWGQCIERTLKRNIDAGFEYIVTMDFDSLFTEDHLDRMLLLMETHPEIDALAPVQAHRDGVHVLMNGADGSRWRNEVVPAKSAHFGLTVFRASAFKKMAHPWFLGVPNESGEWEEGRLDDDMYFWDKWKAAGNTLAIAPAVVIGHMELVAMWPDRNMKHIYQRVDDFWKSGPPKEVFSC